MDEDILEKVRLALPPYLSAESKKELLAQLQQYPRNDNYYGAIPGETEPVQGDAWRGFVAVDFDTLERNTVVGFVISNSCDIAAANNPDSNQNLLFAPVIDLDRYIVTLQEIGKSEQQIQEMLQEIRRQGVHRVLYLPAIRGIQGESIILLDDIYAQPLRTINDQQMARVFTLNNFGWYVLLIKLSIHFTRMQETIDRGFGDAPPPPVANLAP